MKLGKTLYVKDRKAWRAWLSKHYSTAKEIWLIYYKKASGKPRIPYNDAVEEALCFGWIDSTAKGIDSEKFAQRFSPRRRTSILSQLNKERVRKLIASKKMTAAGLNAIAHAYKSKADHRKEHVSKAVLAALKKNPAAWKNFQKLPEAYKRIRLAYIGHQGERDRQTFRKVLGHFVKMTAQNKRFGHMTG
ncbi:MAG: YdeI/OmpD-associated family protein [Candidatus Micrarchaeia archaeon]|jgi:uncharacterized protein YdeI (YjbR/CyaY-like superfamily)